MLRYILPIFVIFSLSLPSFAVEQKSLASVESGSLCELCTLVLGTAQNLLEQNKTDDEVIAFIEKQLCGRLGPINATCTQFMETEGRQIIYELSQKIDPTIICAKIGLCSIKKVESKSVKDGPACELCQLVLGAAKNLLNNNQTDQQVLQFIEKQLCDRLGPLSSVCVNFLETTGQQIIADLVNGLDPQSICKKFGLCTQQKSIKNIIIPKTKIVGDGPACELCQLVLGAAKNLLNNNQTEEQVIDFIEKQLCDRLGPLSGVCVSFLESTGKTIIADLAGGLDPSVVCKKFGLCAAQNINKNLPIFDPNPIECTVCQYVIQFLDLELGNNKTEAAVVNALANVCKFTPASIRDKCENLVNTYGVYLVQLLLEFSDPLKVCQGIKAC